MKQNKNSWLVLVILVSGLGMGCSSVSIEIPFQRVEAPLIGPSDSHAISKHLYQATRVTVVSDAQTRPPQLDPKSYREKTYYQMDSAYAYNANWPIQFGANLNYGLNSTLRARWQFLGERGKIEPGAWMAALFARLSRTSTSRSGDQRTTFGPGGYPWKAEVTSEGAGGGLSIGVGVAERTMLFAGVAYDNYDVHSKIEQSVSATGDSTGGTYGEHTNGQTRSVSIGAQMGAQLAVDVQATLTEIRFTGLPSKKHTHVGAGIEYRF